MQVIKAGTTGGPQDDVCVCRCIGDFGISLFQRAGRSYRPKASSLNRVRDDSIPSGQQVVEPSVFDGAGFWIEIQQREKENHDSETYCGSSFWNSGDRLGSNGPGRTLAGNWSPGDWLLYERHERKRDQPARHGHWRLSRKLSLSLQAMAGR